jgi:NhaP-type Na+/H+ or K+/H+ antiporter
MEHHKTLTCIVLFILLLLVYITIGSWMETMNFTVGHETGVIIIIGIIISILLELWTGNNLRLFSWSNEIFFFVLLPLIIFATGYNMRREKFFENITNIVKFGVVGTILTFIIYFSLTYSLFYYIPGNYDNRITFWNPYT